MDRVSSCRWSDGIIASNEIVSDYRAKRARQKDRWLSGPSLKLVKISAVKTSNHWNAFNIQV